jgi:hypothetical protein
MKTLFVFGFLILSASAFAQDSRYDSIVSRVKDLELKQEKIEVNLIRSHNEFRLGTILQVLGAVAMIAGAEEMDTEDTSKVLFISGASVSGIGLALQIDSHKFIGRAGRRWRRN